LSEPAGYRAATDAVGVIERNDRGWIAVDGADRAAWLHNLVTSEVKNLAPGQGNYAFTLNLKGRILFDLNLLADEDRIWLDLSRDQVGAALTHFDHYLIAEDVTLDDRTAASVRFGIIGPRCAALCASIGHDGLPDMAQLQSTRVRINGVEAMLIRHDFAGLTGAELITQSPTDGASLRTALRIAGKPLNLAEVSTEALDVLRIEAGIPWFGRDIDDTILPAETGQTQRAVSFHKGCYLGQEVVERMRSRGALARQLVGLQAHDGPLPSTGSALRVGEEDVGRLTSVCRSPAVGTGIGLGYVRTAQATPGTEVTWNVDGAPVTATVAALPFRSRS
jgi:folate-binding protein YgfZ